MNITEDLIKKVQIKTESILSKPLEKGGVNTIPYTTKNINPEDKKDLELLNELIAIQIFLKSDASFKNIKKELDKGIKNRDTLEDWCKDVIEKLKSN